MFSILSTIIRLLFMIGFYIPVRFWIVIQGFIARRDWRAIPTPTSPRDVPIAAIFAPNHNHQNYQFFQFVNDIPFEADADGAYSPNNAYWLCDAAYLAYFDQPQVQQWLPPTVGAVEFFDDGESTQGFVLTLENAIIISFRGSEITRRNQIEPISQTIKNIFDDWIVTDADVALIREQDYGRARVHRGFSYATQSVMRNNAGTKALHDAIAQATQSNSPKPVWVTGHSLGAAIATVFSYRQPRRVIKGVYTFGSPRCGDSTWVHSHPVRHNLFRFVHSFDIVTHVPVYIPYASPYQTVGHTKLIDGLGQIHDARLSTLEPLQVILYTIYSALRHPLLLTPRAIGKLALQNPITDHHPCYYAGYIRNQIIVS